MAKMAHKRLIQREFSQICGALRATARVPQTLGRPIAECRYPGCDQTPLSLGLAEGDSQAARGLDEGAGNLMGNRMGNGGVSGVGGVRGVGDALAQPCGKQRCGVGQLR